MVTALTCTSGIVTVWHVLVAWLQYWQLQYTKRAPLVNSSDVGPMTRLSVDTWDHRDVRTVTWNHGYDGLWSESHDSFVAVAVTVFANLPFSQVFTCSPFSQEAPSPVEHTPSAISIETLWTQSTASASSSSSLQQQANTATSTTSNNIICSCQENKATKRLPPPPPTHTHTPPPPPQVLVVTC